jgi:hypothetical protein
VDSAQPTTTITVYGPASSLDAKRLVEAWKHELSESQLEFRSERSAGREGSFLLSGWIVTVVYLVFICLLVCPIIRKIRLGSGKVSNTG